MIGRVFLAGAANSKRANCEEWDDNAREDRGQHQ